MLLDRLLEESNWMQTLFILFVIIGVLISVYLMQITESTPAVPGDSAWMRWLRRGSLAGVALSFLWCLSYGTSMNWEPWPPMVAIVIAIDFNLLMRTITTKLRERSIKRRESRLAVIETTARQ
jgi:hypothetical protein